MGVAEAFPVGEYIEEELEARGWSQADFADILKRPAQFVSQRQEGAHPRVGSTGRRGVRYEPGAVAEPPGPLPVVAAVHG